MRVGRTPRACASSSSSSLHVSSSGAASATSCRITSRAAPFCPHLRGSCGGGEPGSYKPKPGTSCTVKVLPRFSLRLGHVGLQHISNCLSMHRNTCHFPYSAPPAPRFCRAGDSIDSACGSGLELRQDGTLYIVQTLESQLAACQHPTKARSSSLLSKKLWSPVAASSPIAKQVQTNHRLSRIRTYRCTENTT